MATTNQIDTEAKIAKLARSAARFICRLERRGDLEAAAKVRSAALEAVETMRAGAGR